MEKENKLIKGIFEKIDENYYKINGNRVYFEDEVVELIPIIRDIVVQEENIAIEDYNLSRSSYILDKKEIPVANLITEINKWLGSRYIRRKKLENEICYYETMSGKLSVEEELIPLVEDIINNKNRPIEEYKLQKEAYLINNEAVSVSDIVLNIYDLLSRYDLKYWRDDEGHYNIGGEDFYLEDDDVQIIEELINDESELDRSKYEHKKCVYDTDGNECSIINLSLYIHILFVHEVDDDKVRAELKELCLKDKLDRAKKDFAEKVYCFMASLPLSIRRLLTKGEEEYHDLTARIKELDKDMDNNPCYEKLSPAIITEELSSFLENPLEQFFEGTSEEMELLQQKFDSENEEDFNNFFCKELGEGRLQLKDTRRILDDIEIDTARVPLRGPDKVEYYYLQAFVNVHHEEYEQWKDNVRESGILNSDTIIDFYLDTLSMNTIFSYWYCFFEGQIFDRFFHAINYGFIRPEVMKITINKLQELGLSKYVQERYDEYRKLTGGGRDFCFFKQLNMMKVADELSIYYNVDKSTNEKNYFFTRMYLLKVIDEVIPTLKTRLDVAGFALLLWGSKYFNQSICDKNFSVFRDDITRIFELENLPDVKEEYTAGKGPVKKKARELRRHFQFLKPLVEATYLT
ncbi:hypothetical protein [Bacteroides sp. GM023]|uniref:hypothetical protein n=1 Tax=Bacteroides sp. GM023 TaxID=2723058 RepID=UPI00168B14D4|nr:hypothetical protein [Bacteroides sp. GM023]MBD3592329.1 hypothetical protein [Bacteroides sp. GM023]